MAHKDMEIHQMAIKTAFLNGDFEEEIYMEQHNEMLHEKKTFIKNYKMISNGILQ
jgi:hypothetical protein